MVRTNWKVSALAALFALAVLCAARAEDVKPTDEGKAEDFKGKTLDMKEKGEAAILLSCPAGNDTTPGPKCEVKFTPAKAGKYTLLVRNLGPGANKVTLEVKVAK